MPTFDRAECEERFSEHAAINIPRIGAVKVAITRLLRSIDYIGHSHNEDSGRFDRRAIVKFVAGSANVFSRREFKEADTAAVEVMIDVSGSMGYDGGRKICIASVVANQLSAIFEKTGTPYAIIGFDGRSVAEQFIAGGASASDIAGGSWSKHSYAEQVNLYRFKDWHETRRTAALKLGAISGTPNGGTPDFGGVYLAIDELSKRTERRRILFLLTDAEGYNMTNMQHLQTVADKLKITIVAIGIGTNDAKRAFTNAAAVQNVDDLGSVAFTKLLAGIKEC